MIAFPNHGLYAITQCDGKTPETIITEVTAAIRGGAAVIQYRNKNSSERLNLAKALVNLCQLNKIPLIINDDIELAIAVNADGVHLGKEDGDIREARKILGDDMIIGVSCYNDLNRAIDAQIAGADYVAFGRFFPSTSKPLASPAELTTLHKAQTAIQISIVAIGGILPENGGILLEAGADLLAVIGGVFENNPEQSALAFQGLFDRKHDLCDG